MLAFSTSLTFLAREIEVAADLCLSWQMGMSLGNSRWDWEFLGIAVAPFVWKRAIMAEEEREGHPD